MLFDTDIIIWALRGNRKAANLIDKSDTIAFDFSKHIPGKAVTKRNCKFISAVSYMELLKGTRDKNEQKSIKSFISDLGFEILPITENISHRAMIYMEEFALKSGIDIADALIAATSAENSMRLCTCNSKHYKIIPNIELSVFRD